MLKQFGILLLLLVSSATNAEEKIVIIENGKSVRYERIDTLTPEEGQEMDCWDMPYQVMSRADRRKMIQLIKNRDASQDPNMAMP